MTPKYLLMLFCMAIMCIACQPETLLPESVVYGSEKKQTATDEWIRNNFVKPYGIDVNYRWNKYVSPNNTLAPPREENVLAALKTIKELWIDLFDDSRIGGDNFIKNTAPREIYLYSGKNIFRNQIDFDVEIIATEGSPVQMFLYDIDNFNPNDSRSIRNLMRMVHHSFAKMLADKKPFNQEEFLKLTPGGYIDWESSVSAATPLDIYSVNFAPAFNNGFYSFPARKKMIDDFAETFSIMLTHSRQEVERVIKTAGEATSGNPEEIARSVSAPIALKAKRDFVSAYLNDNWNINFLRAQSISAIKTQKIHD